MVNMKSNSRNSIVEEPQSGLNAPVTIVQNIKSDPGKREKNNNARRDYIASFTSKVQS